MIFGLAIEFVMRWAADKSYRGITLIPRQSLRIPEVRFSDLGYINDTAFSEQSGTRKIETTEFLRTKIACKLGLHLNYKITELDVQSEYKSLTLKVA